MKLVGWRYRDGNLLVFISETTKHIEMLPTESPRSLIKRIFQATSFEVREVNDE
jgi:hypothetical protein